MENRKLQAMAGGLFSVDWLQGSPWTLILAVVCFAGGIWYVYHERKTKTKEQRMQEQRQLSKRFLDNINRNQDYLADNVNAAESVPAEEDKPKKAPVKAQNLKAPKKKK